MSIETQTAIPSAEAEDSQINDFVRKGVESANLPPRPQRVVDAMERAFGVDIQHIDEQYVGLGAEGAKRAFGYGEEPQAGETDPEVAGIEASKDMLDLPSTAELIEARPSWISRFLNVIKNVAEDETGAADPHLILRGAAVLLAVGLGTGAIVLNNTTATTHTIHAEVPAGFGSDAAVNNAIDAYENQTGNSVSTNIVAGRVEDAKSEAYKIVNADGRVDPGESFDVVVTDRFLPFTDTVESVPVATNSPNPTESFPPALPLDTDNTLPSPTQIEPTNSQTTIPSPKTH